MRIVLFRHGKSSRTIIGIWNLCKPAQLVSNKKRWMKVSSLYTNMCTILPIYSKPAQPIWRSSAPKRYPINVIFHHFHFITQPLLLYLIIYVEIVWGETIPLICTFSAIKYSNSSHGSGDISLSHYLANMDREVPEIKMPLTPCGFKR